MKTDFQNISANVLTLGEVQNFGKSRLIINFMFLAEC
jgi:hypothetical protein